MNLKTHLRKVKVFHDWDAKQYKKIRYHANSCEGLAYLTRKELVLNSIDLNVGKVLDIGCGPGIFNSYLLNMKLQVYCSDLSVEMIKQAKQGIASNPFVSNAYFTVGDVGDLCFLDNKMDMILCIGVVCYVENYNTLLSEIARVLRPGGKLIIQIDKIRWPTIYNRCVPLYQYLKSKITSKNYKKLNFKFAYFKYHKFIKDLKSTGFTITDLKCFDFRIPFIDIIFPNLSLKIGKMMFNNRKLNIFRCFAHGFIISAAKA